MISLKWVISLMSPVFKVIFHPDESFHLLTPAATCLGTQRYEMITAFLNRIFLDLSCFLLAACSLLNNVLSKQNYGRF